MPFGESMSGTGFEIGFKCSSFCFKGDINFKFPWLERSSMGNSSFIVFGKAGSQIFRNSGITVRFCGNIDLMSKRSRILPYQYPPFSVPCPCRPASGCCAILRRDRLHFGCRQFPLRSSPMACPGVKKATKFLWLPL